MTRFARIYIAIIIVSTASCAQVGYVPLSDVSIDQEVQKNHRETKKFLQKDIRAQNSRLPRGDQFMVKGLRRKPSKLPEGDKFLTIKDRSSASKRNKYKNPKGSKGG